MTLSPNPDEVIRYVNEILRRLDTATAYLLRKHLAIDYGIDMTTKELAFILKKSDLLRLRNETITTRQPYVYARKDYERR